jgi:hypothetical protein
VGKRVGGRDGDWNAMRGGDRCGRSKSHERLPKVRHPQSPGGTLLPKLSERFVAYGSAGVLLLWCDFAPNCALLSELWPGAFRRDSAYCPPYLSAMRCVGAGERSLLPWLSISSECADGAYRACRLVLFLLWYGDAPRSALLPRL